MEKLIKEALDQAYAQLEKQVPHTRKKTKTISVMGVSPTKLSEFMATNNIPDTAYFDGQDNGYDGYNDFVLAWKVEVPTTEKEKSEYRKKRFHDIAFSEVYQLLTANGYNRIGGTDRERITYKGGPGSFTVLFDNKTIYELYKDQNIDKLVEYYSMYYILKTVN